MRLRLFVVALTLCALMEAKTHQDWERSMARLHAGDRLHVSLKTGPVDTTFVSATAQDFTADSGTVKREDVLRIERIQAKGGGSRGKHALIGALIGAGAGAVIGAITGHVSNSPGKLNIVSTGEITGVTTAAGAAVGAAVGSLIPSHRERREIIYVL